MARSRIVDHPVSKPAAPPKVRIDQPHRTASGLPEVDADAGLPAPANEIYLGVAEEKVLAQAAQLASVLQSRLQDLERRESNLHAATAKFEAESRSIRLNQQERESILSEGERTWDQKMAEWRERFQTQIEREERLMELEEQLQIRERQTREEADGLEMARRTLQVERDEAFAQLQQERADFAAQMGGDQAELAAHVERQQSEFQQQMQAERDALLHEIELTRQQDREESEKRQMEFLAETERQRQELFADREKLEQSLSAFEQERALWVVARTGGSPDAFDLAGDRMQLEKDRQAYLAERRQFEAHRSQWIIELDRRQLELDRLRRNGGLPAERAAEHSQFPDNSYAVPSSAFIPTAPTARPQSEALAALADGDEADGGVPFHDLSLEEQRTRLEQAAAYLAREAEDLDLERQQLTEQQNRFKERMRQQTEELQQRLQAIETEHENRRTKLVAREKHLDQQLTNVEQTRQEILKVHRESLEMRLVAEELWAQVSGKVPAAEASQAIAKLRTRLADQYKLENQQLVTKKQQIVELAERLNEQYEGVLRQRRELQAWAAARQIEIEQQAERLVQRELELDDQQNLLQQREMEVARESRRVQQQRLHNVRAA